MLIRRETAGDFAAVRAVIEAAFAAAEHADGNEAELVDALRGSAAFVPELSLTAERGGAVIGHILFTKAAVGAQTVLALAPLAVRPDCQRQGVGAALIQEGHRVARELGYAYSVVLGSERYYPRFGYRPAAELGVWAPFDVLPANFMAARLRGDAAAIGGVMRYAPEFGI